MTRWELLYSKNRECLWGKGGPKGLKMSYITGSSLAAKEPAHFGFGSPAADFIDQVQPVQHLEPAWFSLQAALETFVSF